MSRRKAKPMSGVTAIDDTWVTVREAAAIRRVHRITMILYCQKKVVVAQKQGGKWLVYKPALVAPPGTDVPVAPVERRKRGRPRKTVA
jgi:hypothetical protein